MFAKKLYHRCLSGPKYVSAYVSIEVTRVILCYTFLHNSPRQMNNQLSSKKVFLKISQNSHEIICARVSFLKIFEKFLRTHFLQNTSGLLLLTLDIFVSICYLYTIRFLLEKIPLKKSQKKKKKSQTLSGLKH